MARSRKEQRERGVVPLPQFTATSPTIFARSVVHSESIKGDEKLEIYSQRPDACRTGVKFFDKSASVSRSTPAGTLAVSREKTYELTDHQSNEPLTTAVLPRR